MTQLNFPYGTSHISQINNFIMNAIDIINIIYLFYYQYLLNNKFFLIFFIYDILLNFF